MIFGFFVCVKIHVKAHTYITNIKWRRYPAELHSKDGRDRGKERKENKNLM